MKWVAVTVLALATLVAGYLGYAAKVANPRVIAELRNEPGGARAERVLLLTFPDGRVIPVNYLREGKRVYLGADGFWWRAFGGAGARVELLIRGQTLSGHAVAVLDDPVLKEDVFARLRPTVPAWLPDALNGKLVVITLTDGGTDAEAF